MTPQLLASDAPLWAVQVLAAGQPVVVRRAECAEGWVAVGVRGQGRAQRWGGLMRVMDINRVASPEGLVAGQARSHVEILSRAMAIQALASVAPVLDATRLAWGPTGSVGYQLASGVEVVHADSDLDLLLRTPAPMARKAARDLLDILDCAPCRIDVQLQTPAGAVALREWAGNARRVLLKSASGARLVIDPWSDLECAA
jgi:phosphoribosyl-dephospho-CoA transferase